MSPETAAEQAPDFEALLRTGTAAAERYRRSGSQDDGDTADRCLRGALDLAAVQDMAELPACLAEIAMFDLALHARHGDRAALADAYVLMIEAFLRSRSADGGAALVERTNLVLETVHQAVDRTALQDVDWFIALNQQLYDRVGDQAVVLLQRSIAAGWKAQITQAEPDILAMAEAAEQAAAWYRDGPQAVTVARTAADSWHVLGCRRKDPALIRRGVVHWRRLADEIGGATVGDLATLVCALLQVHHDEPDDSLRREAIERLGQLRSLAGQGVDDGRLGALAGTIMWIIHWEYTRDKNLDHFDEAIDFGGWCVEQIPDTHPALPGVLNNLADCHWVRYGESRRSAEYDRAYALNRKALELAPSGSPEHQRADGKMPNVVHVQRGLGQLGQRAVIGAVGAVHTFDGPVRLPVAEWAVSPTEPVMCRMTARFAAALTNAPGTASGPAPEIIPARSHAVDVTIAAPDGCDVTIETLRVVVDARDPMTIADSMTCRPGPLDASFVCDLDEEPPTVRTATGEDLDSRPAATIPGGKKGQFTLVARTASWDTSWRLELAWKSGPRSGVFTSPPLRTTAETGWRCFDPDGKSELVDPASLAGMTD
ncbi:hypothetical protein [Streptomyces sp. NPDC059802]|uniref:hypothetical protein n=1 Tax=Streptomyces sp. NPDC059802 TaxID=3346952 RepID=UPI00365B0458